MEKCKRLEEYSIFVETVREHNKEDISLVEVITLAMDECIEKGILVDILTKQRSEVLEVVLTTFDQELYEKNLKQDAYEEGKQDGISIGISKGIGIGEYNKLKELILKKLQKGQLAAEIAEALEESQEVIQSIINELTESS